MRQHSGRHRDHRDVSGASLGVLVILLLITIAVLTGVAIFQEACDAYGGWPCTVSDDGDHDGHFNWRHGVIPF